MAQGELMDLRVYMALRWAVACRKDGNRWNWKGRLRSDAAQVSLETLQGHAGVGSRKTIARALKRLEKIGAVEVNRTVKPASYRLVGLGTVIPDAEIGTSETVGTAVPQTLGTAVPDLPKPIFISQREQIEKEKLASPPPGDLARTNADSEPSALLGKSVPTKRHRHEGQRQPNSGPPSPTPSPAGDAADLLESYPELESYLTGLQEQYPDIDNSPTAADVAPTIMASARRKVPTATEAGVVMFLDKKIERYRKSRNEWHSLNYLERIARDYEEGDERRAARRHAPPEPWPQLVLSPTPSAFKQWAESKGIDTAGPGGKGLMHGEKILLHKLWLKESGSAEAKAFLEGYGEDLLFTAVDERRLAQIIGTKAFGEEAA
jgi:hypothetical protein